MRAGDSILHKPTGDKLSVAYADGDEVCTRGWPLTWLRRSDCELIHAVDDLVYVSIIDSMATMPTQDDPRRLHALHEIENLPPNIADTLRRYRESQN